MWGEDGTRRSQPWREERGALGEERDGWEGGKKRVWKWDERVGQLRGITAGQLCIYWSAAAGWFFCQSHRRKKRMKGGKRKDDCCVVLFFFIFIFFVYCQPAKWEVCESAPAEHITRKTSTFSSQSLSCLEHPLLLSAAARSWVEIYGLLHVELRQHPTQVKLEI